MDAKPMTDNTLEASKLGRIDSRRKEDRSNWVTASARVPVEELHLIDAAAYKLRVKRSDLIREAVMLRVHEVLGVRPVVSPEPAPAA